MTSWWASFGSVIFLAVGSIILGLGIYYFVVPYQFEKSYKKRVISKGFASDVSSDGKVNLKLQCPVGKKIYLSSAVLTTVPSSPGGTQLYESRTDSLQRGMFDKKNTWCALDVLTKRVNGNKTFNQSGVSLGCSSGIKALNPSSNEKIVMIGTYDCMDNNNNLSEKNIDCKWWGYTSTNICGVSTTSSS